MSKKAEFKNETANGTKPVLPAVISDLCDALEKSNVKVTFGLQPHHIKAIEAELERFGNREIDAKYVKYVWEKLGKELAWEPFTLALYYFEHLEECRSV
ncbi:MAG: hypothetical protein KBG83_05355 [Bacteroidetes bacterium]|nr:hypothetical protein [Bacteroidota bacterium]